MHDPAKLIKAEKWWNDKATLTLGMAYFLLAASEPVVPPHRYIPALLAFVVAFVGVAGYGHVINDLADAEHDRIAEKSNRMQGKSWLQVVSIILALQALAWLPWLVLPANRWNLSLIGLQELLLTVYAAPPLRLKERVLPGVLTDALYAYTVPVLITWTTWSHIGSMRPRPLLLAALIPWSLCIGLRGILYHQYLDVENDVRSGVRTFATVYGRSRTLWLLSRIILMLELACFAALTLAFSREFWFYPIGLALFALWRGFEIKYLQNQPAAVPPLPSSERFVRRYGYQFLSEFYTLWFPVLMLAALVRRSLWYLPIAIAHVALFDTGLRHVWRYDPRYVTQQILRMRRQHA